MLALAIPALVLLICFFVAPLTVLLVESFRTFVPGRIMSSPEFTLENYAKLLQPAFIGFFLDTFRLSVIACFISLVIAVVFASFVSRQPRGAIRTFYIALLIGMLFVSGMVRVYGLSLSLGTAGLFGLLREWLGVARNSITLLEANVIIGIIHYTTPVMALTLLGTFQNIDPRLEDAAQVLGATRYRAMFDTTLALAVPGLTAAFFLGYAMAISAFTIPVFLGNGIVVSVTMLIFQRFSEIPNFPFGAAISVTLLASSLLIVLCGLALVRRLSRAARDA
jgi:ABC-type spermidine/putrescine transport system permease subunit I